jgi:hypothetical protein
MADLWAPKRRIEEAYRKALRKVLLGLADSLTDYDDPLGLVRAIKRFSYSRDFDRYAEATATQLVTHLFTDAGRTWRQAARANSRGRMVYQALRREMQGPLGGAIRHQIERNASIIKSLPLDVAKHATEHILSEHLRGARSDDIVSQIQGLFPHFAETRARLIARTETSKTSTALTQSRSQLVGVQWYVWRTAHDGDRVRASHRIMEGVLVRWNIPPNPEALEGEKHAYGHYHAGEIFNCRCYPEPVIDLSMISWPAKVYYGGAIQRMTRYQFEQITG